MFSIFLFIVLFPHASLNQHHGIKYYTILYCIVLFLNTCCYVMLVIFSFISVLLLYHILQYSFISFHIISSQFIQYLCSSCTNYLYAIKYIVSLKKHSQALMIASHKQQRLDLCCVVSTYSSYTTGQFE